ncbi:hypothetical protein P9273_21380 [Mesorhizobium sp. WSM4935]|uniref:hypothetical protein n=1 Tax=Mesorhizobium sp. WSM4935 TaxID=3038547 RepID=UPI0024150490|nr:hypothetical protein [Mesorhizobium sp. WSM4935]MDG4877658.1 hypothetical protein [Mesorhizobium sp. WSM4935]
MTKYFVDGNGNYLGGLDGVWVLQGADEDGNEVRPVWQAPDPPPGAIEVPDAPENVRQIWQNGAWSSIPVVVPSGVSAR